MITKKMFPGKLAEKAILQAFHAILLLVVVFGCLAETMAQPYPVTITVAVTPPYTSKIDDYISQPNKIMATFLNTGPYPLDVYVLGSIRSEGGINVYTDPGYAMSPPLTLLPGVPYTLNRFNLEQVFDERHLECQGITLREVLYGNGLPEEDYTICMLAFNYETGEPVSAESPQGCSNTFTVAGLEPPVITGPVSGEDIFAEEPQNVIFSWTRPPGAPVNTEFVLKLIEILPSDRNINDAFNSARSPVFFEKTLTTSQYLFGPADPRLVTGKSYAFSVTAVDPARNLSFRNNGVSEIASFNYIKPEPACGGWPVAWDVNTVRKLYYSVNIQTSSEGEVSSAESYLLTLDFVGDGSVNYISDENSENKVIACKMSPGGNLTWDYDKGEIPTAICIALSPLQEPPVIIINNQKWIKYSYESEGNVEQEDALIQSYKGDFEARSSFGLKGNNIINIETRVFTRIEPNEAAKDFFQKNGMIEMDDEWVEYVVGSVYFNCNKRCVEKADFQLPSIIKGGPVSTFSMERKQQDETKIKE